MLNETHLQHFQSTLHGQLIQLDDPHYQDACQLYNGALDSAEAAFQSIRQFGPPALDLVGPLPYPAM